MPERFLIFGSRGFLASKLLQRLEQSGREVIRGDRNGTVPPGVNSVIYCASYGNMAGQEDKREIWKANVDTFKKIADHNVKNLIYLSSSSVLLKDATEYAMAKAMGEVICLQARGIAVRPSSITGGGEQRQHLIPKLVDSCLHGTEMPFVGEPTHDFVNVEDVASAIGLLLQIPEARGKAFNVSSGRTISNYNVLHKVERLTGKDANVKPVESMRSYDTKDWRVDNTQMRELGWVPRISLNRSIIEIIKEHDN